MLFIFTCMVYKIGFYRILGCKMEKQPLMFSNTPKKVVIFKKTTVKVDSAPILEVFFWGL
jgi:hypothetical protein